MDAEYQKKSKKLPLNPYAIFLASVAIVAIAAGGFYGGVSYQKNRQTTTVASSSSIPSSNSSSGSRFAGRANRVVGQVTAISASSISVQNARTGQTDTLSLTASTQVTSNGQSVSPSTIQVGDTVFITKDSASGSNATRIAVNPSFGGQAGPQSSQSAAPTPVISSN